MPLIQLSVAIAVSLGTLLAVPMWRNNPSEIIRAGMALAQIVWIATAVSSLFLSDRLLQRIYQEHHSLWREVGEPSGFFWTPKNRKWLKGQKAAYVHHQIFFGRINVPEADFVYASIRRKLHITVLISVLGAAALFLGIVQGILS